MACLQGWVSGLPAVGVQPRAHLPGDRRGLEGVRGQLEVHPCLGPGRGTGSGLQGITAQGVPTLLPGSTRPASSAEAIRVASSAGSCGCPPHPQQPLSSRSPSVAAARDVSRPETFTHMHLEVPRSLGVPGGWRFASLGTQSCFWPEALPLGAPCVSAPCNVPGGGHRAHRVLGFVL